MMATPVPSTPGNTFIVPPSMVGTVITQAPPPPSKLFTLKSLLGTPPIIGAGIVDAAICFAIGVSIILNGIALGMPTWRVFIDHGDDVYSVGLYEACSPSTCGYAWGQSNPLNRVQFFNIYLGYYHNFYTPPPIAIAQTFLIISLICQLISFMCWGRGWRQAATFMLFPAIFTTVAFISGGNHFNTSGITKPRGRLDYEGFGVAFWSCMASMCILWVCFIVAVMDYVLKNCTNGRFGVKGRTKDPESSADGMELGKPTTMSVHAYPSSEYSCSAYEQSVAHQMSQLAQQQNVLQQQLMLQQQQLNMAKPPVPVMVGGPSGWDTVSTGSGHPSQHQQYGQAAYNGMDARKFSTYSMPSPTGQNGTAQRTSLSTMPTMDGYQPTPTTTMYSGPESASAVEKEACVTELDEIEAQLREMVDDFNKQ